MNCGTNSIKPIYPSCGSPNGKISTASRRSLFWDRVKPISKSLKPSRWNERPTEAPDQSTSARIFTKNSCPKYLHAPNAHGNTDHYRDVRNEHGSQLPAART